jgi:hypothetical protein
MSAVADASAMARSRLGVWRRPAGASLRSIRFVLTALVASRLVVLAAALAGELLGHRRDGWVQFDPTFLTAHLGAFGTPLAAAAVRWDGLHYLAIASHGYGSPADTAFFPLYPLLIAIAGVVTRSPVVAGVFVSLASFSVVLTLLHRLTEDELGRRAADTTVLLLCCAPLSLFFSAVYTESLFLALSVGAIYAIRHGRPTLACCLAALATITRVPGILLTIPVWMMWPSVDARRGPPPRRRPLLGRLQLLRGRPQLLLPPVALACFLAYLAVRGYGLTAPFSQQAAGHGHSFAGPLGAIVSSLRAGASGLGALVHGTQPVLAFDLLGPLSTSAESVVLVGVLALALVALAISARRLPAALTVYAALALIVSISSPVSGQPLQSLDRYLLVIFPLWMAAGSVLSRPVVRAGVVGGGLVLLVFYSFQFATWSFVG